MKWVLGLVVGLGSISHAEEINVMVIDTGIGVHSKLKDYVQYKKDDPNYIDKLGHGTHVAGIIAYGNERLNDPICKQVKIHSCNFYAGEGLNKENIKNTVECIKQATKLKMNYINYSGGGISYSFNELNALREYIKTGGYVITSAGNEKDDLRTTPFYPASYAYGFTYESKDPLGFTKTKHLVRGLKNIIVVENEGKDGKLMPSSNRHPLALRANGDNIYSTLPNDTFGSMTGTSQAAPAILHFILKQRCEEINFVQKSELLFDF